MRKCVKSVQKCKNALFAPKAENVALANGLIGVLGAQNATMEKMTKFGEI